MMKLYKEADMLCVFNYNPYNAAGCYGNRKVVKYRNKRK